MLIGGIINIPIFLPSPSPLPLQVFRIITSNFADVDSGLLASLHDTPWTMIKLAHTARKQGLTEVCLNSLSKLYSVATMDVQVGYFY